LLKKFGEWGVRTILLIAYHYNTTDGLDGYQLLLWIIVVADILVLVLVGFYVFVGV
jgi:hypothetical protein